MFSRPKILFLVSLLFVALLNQKFNPYLPFKFLIFYHSSVIDNNCLMFEMTAKASAFYPSEAFHTLTDIIIISVVPIAIF